MPYIGNPSAQRFTSPRAASVYSGDGSTVAFTLEEAVSTDEDILVSVDGVIQEPSVAYAVSSGTTLTFTAAPSSNSGNNIFVYYIARTFGSVSMPDGQNVNAANFSASGTGAITGNTTVGGTLGITGALTAGSVAADGGVTVDNITIDGTEIDLSSGSLTVDSAGNITLDCGTGELLFNNADNGNLLKIQAASSNVNIIAMVQDKDIVFKGDDGGSSITPVSIDMSEGGKLKVTGGTSGDNICDFDHTLNGSAYGPVFKTSGVANDNNTTYFLTCVDSSAVRMRLYSDGDLINHDNSYGAISDERIKQDIVDASSQWNDIKALKIRHYKKKDDVITYGDKAQKELGVIAQELEASGMNGLVKPEVTYKDYDADVRNGIVKEGDVKDYKSVKYSILYMKAIKCLQEAITKIETLETETTALKARVKTLEDA